MPRKALQDKMNILDPGAAWSGIFPRGQLSFAASLTVTKSLLAHKVDKRDANR